MSARRETCGATTVEGDSEGATTVALLMSVFTTNASAPFLRQRAISARVVVLILRTVSREVMRNAAGFVLIVEVDPLRPRSSPLARLLTCVTSSARSCHDQVTGEIIDLERSIPGMATRCLLEFQAAMTCTEQSSILDRRFFIRTTPTAMIIIVE